MRYKLVAFDLDGTLADTFPWFLSVLNDFARTYRFKEVRPEEVETLRRYSSRQVVRHLGIPAWKLPWIARGMRSRMSREIARFKLFDGTEQMLRELSGQGVELALLTSNSQRNALSILGENCASHLRYFRCGISIFGKRPQLRKLMRQAGVQASETLYIGDELRDLEAARAEGIAFGGVAWGYTHPEAIEAQRPEFLFRRMEEIVEAIK